MVREDASFGPTMRCALVLLAVLAAAGARAQPQRPDIVVVVADDLGMGDVGYAGATDLATPHLDALAAEGVVLDRFYVAPRCSPSRAGLLTGRYPSRMGVSEAVAWADTVGLPAAETTLPERLRAAGYETALVGKWHLGTACRHHPTRHGFDAFVGLLGGGARYFTRETPHGVDWWRGVTAATADGYTTDVLADEAVARLTAPREAPLYLHLAFTAPHVPNEARPDDLARHPDLDEPRRTHVAMVERLDHAVGRVMDAVRASPRPTLVWFLSDNGAIHRHGGANAPLRGEKGQALEGGIRVPAVVWYPAWESRRIEHPVWYLDLAPTLADLAGAPAAGPPPDGASQADQLAGAPPTRALLDRVLYTFMPAADGGAWLAAQTAAWKYVGVPDAGDGLFHIATDASEQTDVGAEHPAVLGRLRAGARAHADGVPAWATRDLSLPTPGLLDLTACGGTLAPRPTTVPLAVEQERARRDAERVRLGWVWPGLAVVLALAAGAGGLLFRRRRAREPE